MMLRNKIAVVNTFITLAVLLISCLVIIKSVDNFNLYTVYQSLLGQSNFSRQYLSEYFKLRQDPVKALEEERAGIENKLGTQAGCTVDIASINIQNPKPLQKKALDGSGAYLIVTEASVRQFYISSPITVQNRVIGAVTFKFSLYRVDSMRKNLQVVLSFLFFIAIAVSLLFNYFFSYRAIKPLEKLTGATKEFSRDNFKEITGIRTGDEIEKLTVSFNDMGHAITKMFNELKMEQEKQKKFLDNVTHEVRTPLTNIIGYVDLVKRITDDSQKKKYISYITDESNRLLEMVNNMLELSQLNRYEFSILKEDTNLPELIDQVSGLMAYRAKKFGFEIVNNLDQVTASVDREKIKQVIINLIDNAIKYSGGNTIEIKLSKEQTVEICVSDNGMGIPEEDIENLTEPFYRVDKSRSRKLGGSGLGLAICKEIVNAHNGTMVIESKERSGTIVTISLQP